MDTPFNYGRAARLIRLAVDRFNLDLQGLTVYTEAATGNFAVTTPLAVAANAECVYSISRDSPHGSAKEAYAQTGRLVNEVGSKDVVDFVREKRPDEVGAADIVTNTGFVRPINQPVVSWLKPTAAIPLMYEPWEFRSSDIDIQACWRTGVPVVGTDERDERIRTQRYVGPLAAKLSFQCDIEVLNSRIVVLGGGRMAVNAVETLEAMGAEVTLIASNARSDAVRERLDARPEEEQLTSNAFGNADGLFVIDHATHEMIIGDPGWVQTAELASANPSVTIVHICGPVDTDAIFDANLRILPEKPAPPGYMSFTTGNLGPRPIVDLHAAGLRIGQHVARARRAGESFEEAIHSTTELPFAADFSDAFKLAHDYQSCRRGN